MGPGTPSDTLDVYLPDQYNDGFFFNGYETLFSGSVGHPTFIPASFDFPYAGFSNGFGYTFGERAPNGNSGCSGTATVSPSRHCNTLVCLVSSPSPKKKASGTAEQFHAQIVTFDGRRSYKLFER